VHYFPIAFPFVIAFAVLLVFLVVSIELGILRYAYEKIGVGRRHMFALLAMSFLGSYVNIPVFQLSSHAVATGKLVEFHGMLYVVPIVRDWPGTVIAVNLGGAAIPVLLSIYLLLKNRLFKRGLLGVSVVAVCVHAMAYPVEGVGIAVPIFVPPVIASVVALLLSRQYAPPLAYITGSLGTLIGADLLNLGEIEGLGAPIASIGGAGTFDGIFMSGILSVLLAGLVTRRSAPTQNSSGI
jgi:uncharacterized membrane protein